MIFVLAENRAQFDRFAAMLTTGHTVIYVASVFELLGAQFHDPDVVVRFEDWRRNPMYDEKFLDMLARKLKLCAEYTRRSRGR